jgi:hypothetical protein
MIPSESRRRFDAGIGYGWFFSGAPPRQGPLLEFSYYPVLWPNDADAKKARTHKLAARKAARANAAKLKAKTQVSSEAKRTEPTDDDDDIQDDWAARLALRVTPQMLFGNPGETRSGGAVTALFGVEIQSAISRGCGAGASADKNGLAAGAACYRGAFGIGIGLQSSFVASGDTRYATLGIGVSVLTPGFIGAALFIPNPALFIPRR